MADNDAGSMSEQELRDFATKYPTDPLSEQIRKKYGMGDAPAPPTPAGGVVDKAIGLGKDFARGVAKDVVAGRDILEYSALPGVTPQRTSDPLKEFADRPTSGLGTLARVSGEIGPFFWGPGAIAKGAGWLGRGIEATGQIAPRLAEGVVPKAISEASGAPSLDAIATKAQKGVDFFARRPTEVPSPLRNWQVELAGVNGGKAAAEVAKTVEESPELASLAEESGPEIAQQIITKTRDPNFLQRVIARHPWKTDVAIGAAAGAAVPEHETKESREVGAGAGAAAAGVASGLRMTGKSLSKEILKKYLPSKWVIAYALADLTAERGARYFGHDTAANYIGLAGLPALGLLPPAAAGAIGGAAAGLEWPK